MMIGRKRRSNVKVVALGSALAAVGGYIAGILTAPKSGKQTRDDIKQGATKAQAEAEKDLKKLHTELDNVIKQAKAGGGKLGAKAQAEMKELTEKAKDSKEKVREVLSAIHEGEAEDKDLERAVKNANLALKNLRKYLKK